MKLYLVFFWYEDIDQGHVDNAFCDVFKTYEAARAYIGDRNFIDTAPGDYSFELSVDFWGDYARWELADGDVEYDPSFFTIFEKEI